ncbi:hypothetical protein D3Y57_04960 (plasmid) [Sphingomonas paeninsulae]|uniref:Uncharacterized protein n=1 Tax=Sphingomonas paeninsulae TaxID=2319844 RepID=A0A494T7Q6_SPHPE|nr:hypothetical protein D3Y57_04960 [Sphingomonas paeninsulae]
MADVDARLGGGLARAALHEFFAAGPADVSALAGFAVLLAVRAQLGSKPVIWVREDRGIAITGGFMRRDWSNSARTPIGSLSSMPPTRCRCCEQARTSLNARVSGLCLSNRGERRPSLTSPHRVACRWPPRGRVS